MSNLHSLLRPLTLAAMLSASLLSGHTLAAPAAAASAPPAAPSRPAVDTYHGQTVTDPYRNLEDLRSPETQAWLKAQGTWAADQLARIDGRAAMGQRVQALSQTSGDQVRGVLRMSGGRTYYLLRPAGENQFKLVMRQGFDGPLRVLVDTGQLARSTGVPHAINYFVPSWDGKTLAYGLSAGGSEDASLYLMDIASGKPLCQPIPRVHEEAVHWAPDSRSLAYNQVRVLPKNAPPSELFLDTTVYWLRLGDLAQGGRAARAAKPIFGPLSNPELKLDRLDVGQVIFAPDSPFMLARTTDTTVPQGRLFVAPVSELGRKTVRWQPIATARDKIVALQLRGSTLYLQSLLDAPLGRVLSLSLPNTDLTRAVEVLGQPDRRVLAGFSVQPDGLYTEQSQGFNTRVLRHPLTGGPGVDVAPKQPGSTYLVEDASGGGGWRWWVHVVGHVCLGPAPARGGPARRWQPARHRPAQQQRADRRGGHRIARSAGAQPRRRPGAAGHRAPQRLGAGRQQPHPAHRLRRLWPFHASTV